MNSLRATFKYSGWSQKNQVINGTIPGFNDSKQYKPVVSTWAVTGNYTFNPTTFLEATYGHSQNELTGCGLAQGGTGPTFCQNGFAMNPIGNRFNAGLGNIPFLFPDANVIDPSYYAFEALSGVNPPNFVDGRVVVPPSFTWGSRVSNNNPNYAPPNTPFPGLPQHQRDRRHLDQPDKSLRAGTRSRAASTTPTATRRSSGAAGTGRSPSRTTTTTPSTRRSGMPTRRWASSAVTTQASKYVEGSFVYNNTEAYIQDNWKVNDRLTLDYGVRFVHQQPQYDDKGQASNFLPEKWAVGQAPQLYLAGCPNNVNPCAAASRQAMNPVTGQLLGPGTNVAIGGLVPNSGNTLNGLFLSGQGITKTTYTWPALAIAPRFGMAYDVTGRQKMVLRGGAGLFFDRPSGNSIYSQVQNPPTYTSVTVRNAQLQTLASGGLTISGAPALNVFEYAGNLPSSTQWNGGLQMALPWSSALDVEYVGQHSFNTLDGVDINAIDFGAAFLPQNQDLTLQPNATPGAMAVAQDQMRAFRGYAGITQQWGRGWRTFHSLQLSFNRRFKDGLSFGFNDTIVLADNQSTGARLQHNADGTYALRSDQAEADELLGTVIANRHLFKGNFVWDLPDIRSSGTALKALGVLVNDWQVSGVWTGATGSAYTVGFSYQSGGGNVNLTGSPSYGARVRVVADPGSGCSGNVYQQFNTAAFQGPLTNSVGLESGADYLRGCFTSVLDLAIARNIRLGGARNLQLRVDMFNAPNSAIITGRNTTMNLSNPNDPVTVTNLPYDASGNLIPALRCRARRGSAWPTRTRTLGEYRPRFGSRSDRNPRRSASGADLLGPVAAGPHVALSHSFLDRGSPKGCGDSRWQTSPDGISSSALCSPASSREPGLAACRRSRRWAINHPTKR